jgi:hypothetical protein
MSKSRSRSKSKNKNKRGIWCAWLGRPGSLASAPNDSYGGIGEFAS